MYKNFSLTMAGLILVGLTACTGSNRQSETETIDSLNVAEQAEETTQEEEATQEETQEFILADGKLGPIKEGMTASSFPKQVEGLYDKFEFVSYENEMDGYIEEYYTFTEAGKEVFRANTEEGKVVSFTLYEGSSNIKTADGIYVGYSARELFKKKKLKWEFYFDTGLYGNDGKYTYGIDPNGYKPESTPEKVSDLKPDAKVCYITH